MSKFDKIRTKKDSISFVYVDIVQLNSDVKFAIYHMNINSNWDGS